jgi:hypothetical protein
MYPDISNPAGYSQHELRSDGPGTNKGIQRGAKIPVWMCGVDSGGDDTASRQKISAAASHYGWTVAHPYSRGVEGHHWRFDKRPHANRHAGANMWQIIKLRRMLPKS